MMLNLLETQIEPHQLSALLAFARQATVRIEGFKEPKALADLLRSIETGRPNWELLRPFYGKSTDVTLLPDGWVAFEVEVPVSHYVRYHST